MSEQQPTPGVRRVDEAEQQAVLLALTQLQQAPDGQPQPNYQERPRMQGPATFQGHGFGAQPAGPRQSPPQYTGPRYGNGQPAYHPHDQPHSRPAPGTDYSRAASGHDELTAQSGLADDEPGILEKTRNFIWDGRDKRTRVFIGVAAASLVVTGTAIKAQSDAKGTPISGVLGIADVNEMTFTEPDCFQPAISGEVEQKSSYIVNYKNVVINKAEIAKKKQSKSYRPKTIDSFDDQVGAIKMQSDKKPTTPFSKDVTTTERLPATLYDGELNLGICNKSDMSEVVHVDGSSVEIDASKLALTYDPSDEINKKAIIAYEKYAPKAPGKSNPGYITDKEYDRIRRVVVPKENDTALNNPKFDNTVTAATLNGLKDQACLDNIQSTSRKYFEAFLRDQQPGEKFTISWKGGGFVMPDKGFSEKSRTEKDVKIIDSQTKCQPFTFNNPSSKE